MTQLSKTRQNIAEAEVIFVDLATGGSSTYEDYENARDSLLSDVNIKSAIPDWLTSCKHLSGTSSFFKEPFY